MRRRSRVVRWFGLLALLLGCAGSAAAQGRPFGNADLSHLQGISDVQLSPDGARLVCVRTTTDYDSDRTVAELVLVRVEGGESSVIARGGMPRWSPDGRLPAYRSRDGGATSIVLYDLASGARQLTRENESLVRQVALQSADSIWFRNSDGTPVQGWLIRPAGLSEGARAPLILSVHGGPHGMYGWGFSDQVQLLAAAGYAVLFINPRGSTSYGQAFSDGSILNWGGGDYQDLMAGVDHVLERFPWLDGKRMGSFGGSYGGFMTNWIVTQTDRFRGAVARVSVSNLVSFYGTSIYSDLIEVEFDGLPWHNRALLWQWSPLAHVHKARTPTLLLHGENDNDVPFSQAEEMYIALKKLGVESVLVRYPGEGHGIARPVHRLDMYRRMQDWFDRHGTGISTAERGQS